MLDEVVQDLSPEEEEALYKEQYMDLLVFEIAGSHFGCPLENLDEIVEPLPLTPVPQSIESFRGIFNLRGRIISALDVRKRFYSDIELVAPSAYAIVKTAVGPVAMLLEKIIAVTSIERAAIDKQRALGASLSKKYILGFTDLEGDLLVLVDLPKILTEEEVAKLSEQVVGNTIAG